MSFNLIIPIAFIIILVSVLFSIHVYRRKRKAVSTAKELILPNQMPSKGVNVPVLEAFAGLKTFGPITFWHNNLCPALVLYEDHFEYQAFRMKSAQYSDIEMVRSFRSKYYNRMRIGFVNTDISFIVVFTDGEMMDRVLDFLEAKGIIPDIRDKI